MKQVLHLDLQIQNEFPTVEELSQGRLRLKPLGDLDIDLLRYLLQLIDFVVVLKSVRRHIERTCVICGCYGERIFVVFEDQSDYIVDRVDCFVHFVAF